MRALTQLFIATLLTIICNSQLAAQSLNTVEVNVINASGIPVSDWLIEPFRGNILTGSSGSTNNAGRATLNLGDGKHQYRLSKGGKEFFVGSASKGGVSTGCDVKNCQAFTIVVPPDAVANSQRIALLTLPDDTENSGTSSAMIVGDGELILTIPNPSSPNVNLFGLDTAVTPSGDIIVSALNWVPALGGYNGRVYLIDGTTGATLLDIPNPNPSGTNFFGWSVAAASNGDIVVGDFGESVAGVPAGAVYVFDGSTGIQLFKLNNPNPTSGDDFGWAIATTVNGSIVVGSTKETNGGAVYVYDYLGALQQSIFNPSTDPAAGFGASVQSTSNGSLLIGAPFQNVVVGANVYFAAGSVYLYSELTGTQLLYIDNPTPTLEDYYGWVVGVTGTDNLIVNSLNWDEFATDVGNVFLHDGTSGALLWDVPNPVAETEGLFGTTLSGTPQGHIAIGAPGNDMGAENSGRVFVFDGVSGDLIQILDNPAPWGDASFSQGLAVSGTGEFVVGAFVANGGPGQVYVFSSVTTGDSLILLNDLNFVDSNLESCVLDTAAVNAWAIVSETTALDCSYSAISDLSGIEALSELTTLDLSNNDFTDIGALESLTNLTSLDLTGNVDILCTDLNALELALGVGVVIRPATCDATGLLLDGQVQSLHNAQGQRVVKSVGGSTDVVIHFIYDQAGRVIAEIDAASGATTREYIYVNGIQVALVDDTATQNEATYFVHSDHLGTPQKITDSSQTVVWGASYEPFGEVTETASVIENNIRFPGQYEDGETGLSYNYFRDYDASLGRYVESDPIGLEGGMNTFVYTSSNPIRYSDPLGLFFAGPVCGSQGNSQFFPDGKFTSACSSHDTCYGCQGKKDGTSKSQCDAKFLDDMYSACSENPSPGCRTLAMAYFSGVSRSLTAQEAFINGRRDCDGCPP